ncbi:hypothetical protein EON81_02525 [bacterium]|nr:MAG: hypothetical protein EON81_02525 [bacterium]
MKRLLPFLLLIAAGCGAKGPAPVALVAIDASGSARPFLDRYIAVARDLDETLPPGSRLEMYRFDTRVDEIHVGEPLEAAPFKRIVVEAMAKDRGQQGTSILKFAERADERIAKYAGRPIEILVLTDCGVEEMKPDDHAKLKEIVATWAKNPDLRSVRLFGVRPLHHDVLRKDFDSLGERLKIE